MTRTGRFALLLLVATSFLASAAIVIGAASMARGSGGLLAALGRAGVGVLTTGGSVSNALAAVAPLAAAPASNSTWFEDDDDGLGYAVIEPGEGTSVFSSSRHSTSRLNRLANSSHEPTVWFSRDDGEWVIRDRETVARAKEIVAPLREVSEEMGHVGGEMGRIGGRQGRLGGQMGRLGGRLARLQVHIALSDVDDEERARMRSEIEQIRGQMDELRGQMNRGEDRRRQSDLSQQLHELSRRHAEVRGRVREQMRSLIERAIREGKAERLGDTI